jgi:hypothetical protein
MFKQGRTSLPKGKFLQVLEGKTVDWLDLEKFQPTISNGIRGMAGSSNNMPHWWENKFEKYNFMVHTQIYLNTHDHTQPL